MNRINSLFQAKPGNILSIYFTAGYPALNDTRTIIETIAHAGADMIEIGIPFSDPLADGPVIQQSSQAALENGMTLDLLLQQVKDIRQSVSIPLILMGYLNPILQFGMDRFCKAISGIGIDGVIIPDLPLREYELHYNTLFAAHNIKPVFLVTPQTTEERIRKIDALTDSFIYLVTTAGTTGGSGAFADDTVSYFKRIQDMKLKNPVIAGFGISSRESFEAVCQYTNGGIIGSGFIKAISGGGELVGNITSFIKSIWEAVVVEM